MNTLILEKQKLQQFYNEVCYTSGIYDGLSNLYYFNARYYNSSIQRFITMDTYRGEFKNTITLNLYTYCKGNPIKFKKKYFDYNQRLNPADIGGIDINPNAKDFVFGYKNR